MATQTVKQRVLEAVEALPAEATIEDAMERLYFLAKIQRGLVCPPFRLDTFQP